MKQSSSLNQDTLYSNIEELGLNNITINKSDKRKILKILAELHISEDGITVLEGNYKDWVSVIAHILSTS